MQRECSRFTPHVPVGTKLETCASSIVFQESVVLPNQMPIPIQKPPLIIQIENAVYPWGLKDHLSKLELNLGIF